MATSAFSWMARTTNKGAVNAFLKYKHIYTNCLVFNVMLGEDYPSWTWHEEKRVVGGSGISQKEEKIKYKYWRQE